jgi:nicotinate-nucleotide adenylyltransferase
MSPRAVAIFGGSFNPIHLGHLAVAEEVRIRYGLEKVIFVPAHQSPHKDGKDLADAQSRLVMAHLATLSNPFFEVSDFEVERGGLSYSIDTIRHFKDLLGDASLHFILGADMLMELSTWKNIDEALRLCRFIVVTRPGFDAGKIMNHRLLGAFGQGLEAESLENIRLEDCIKMDVSSTAIRRWVREGRSVKYLVPEAVEQFIHHQKLYL